MTNATAQLTLSLHDITVHAGVYHDGLAWAVAMPAGWRCVEEGVRRAATTTRPAPEGTRTTESRRWNVATTDAARAAGGV